MTHVTKPKTVNYLAGADKRISISFENALHDLGIVAGLPKAVLWFYRFLVSDGERLDDREMLPLVMLISLKGGLNGCGLCLTDLPTAVPLKTLRCYLTKWKRMGLVFTYSIGVAGEMDERLDDNPSPALRPRRVVYDLSNLFYNISLIAEEYARRNLETLAEWERSGGEGERPVYQFPKGYAHQVRLAPEVAARIVDEESGYVHKKHIAARWIELANRMVNKANETPGACTKKRENGETEDTPVGGR